MSQLTSQDLEIVRRTPLFVDFTEAALNDLLKDAWVKEYPRGALLFLRGDPVTRFFVVLTGWVKVFRDTPSGEQSVVHVMKPGESFAQAAIFTGRQDFPASAEVVDDARIVEIPSAPFMARLHADSRLAIKMLGAVSARLLQLVQHIEQLQFRSTAQRLADFLANLSTVRTGPASLRLPYDKSLIAARLGMKPESLSRAIAKLRKVGVTVSGSTVSIKDMAVLRTFAAGDEDEE